eukprot:514026_1
MPDKQPPSSHPIQHNAYNDDDGGDDIKENPLQQPNDTEQAQINAFIHDDHEDDNTNSTANNEPSHGLFNRIGQIFKKKKKKSITQTHNQNNNNNNNDTMTLPQPEPFNEQQISDLVGGDTPWNCEKCTFLNEATELHCVVCFYSRFEVKNLAAQWQWKAADRWITYGIPETTEIENAFKSGAKEVSLTKGWFASNPNLYCIYFDKEYGNKKHQGKHNKNNQNQHQYHDESTYFYQINTDTSTKREVRRIASDDDNLFKQLMLNELDEKDRKCMICLHEFNKKKKK